MTRILKEYGDTLDKYHVAPEKADISKELRVLRCVLLLIELTGAVHSELSDCILNEATLLDHFCKSTLLLYIVTLFLCQ